MRRVLHFLFPTCVLAALTHGLVATDRFPAGDGPHMLGQGMRLGRWIVEGRFAEAWQAFAELVAPHPPFGYLPIILASMFTREIRFVIAFNAVCWALVLLDASIRLVRPAPIWSAQLGWFLLVASSPFWWSADHAGFDLAAAAAILQALSWLRASEGFKRVRESIVFAAWLAAAFLTKYSGPLILALPVAWAVLHALVQCQRVWRGVPAGDGGQAWRWLRRVTVGPGRRRLRRHSSVPADERTAEGDIRRHPTGLRGLLAAGAMWSLLWVPWAMVNGRVAAAYVGSALSPPSTPGFYPETLSLLDRISGEGQGMFLAVLKVSLGGALLLVCLAAAARERRREVLLALFGGVIALGAMNSREARYALPLVALLAVAAVPSRPDRRLQAGVLGALGLPLAWGTWTNWTHCHRECAPDIRPLRVDVRELTRLGTWPTPHPAFLPLSEHPEFWAVDASLDALLALGQEGPLGILVDARNGPGVTTWQLTAETRGMDLSIVTIVARTGPRGLEEARFKGPFPGGTDGNISAVLIVAPKGALEGQSSATGEGGAALAWADAYAWAPIQSWPAGSARSHPGGSPRGSEAAEVVLGRLP